MSFKARAALIEEALWCPMNMDVRSILGDLLLGLSPTPFPSQLLDLTEDSREVRRGSIFVAIRGTLNDGHLYIKEAVQRGAGGVIVEDPGVLPALSVPWLQVRSTRRALGLLAAASVGNPALELGLIGITGTNGKTSTSYLLESMVAGAGRRCGLIGTVVQRSPGGEVASERTTPPARRLQGLLAEMRREEVSWVVMEVTSHGLDMERIAGCPLDGVVLTNLSRDHLDYHGSMASYKAAKLKIIDELATSPKPKRWVAWWADDPSWQGISIPPGIRCRPYREVPKGEKSRPDDDAIGVTLETMDWNGLEGWLITAEGRVPFRSRLIGRHNALNIAAAAAGGLAIGLEPDAIVRGVERLERVPGRLERVPVALPFPILVDYAHTPDALDTVLKTLKGFGPRRLLVVFGCGGDRDRGKRPLMGSSVARAADWACVTSDNPRHEDPEGIIREVMGGMKGPCRVVAETNRRRAIEKAMGEARAGDLLLIAGKGHESYQIVGDMRIPFDDREVVMELAGGSSVG